MQIAHQLVISDLSLSLFSPSLPLALSLLLPSSSPNMSDLVTTLRHTSCRASESLQSYLRTSSSLSSQLSDLQSRFSSLQSERVSLKTDEEVNALLAAVRSSSSSVVRDLESKLTASQETASALKVSLAEALLSIETLGRGQGEEARRLEKEKASAIEAERRSAADAAKKAASDKEAVTAAHGLLVKENERLILANANQAKSIAELNIAVGRLNDVIDDLKGKGLKAGDDASKQTKELETKLRKEIEGLKKEARGKDEDLGKAKEDFQASMNLVVALKDEIESLKKDVLREKKGRDVAERELRSGTETHAVRIAELKEEHKSSSRALEARIKELEEELSKLRDAPVQEPMPDASKFKMYVDLKAENSKLSKQLQKTKDLNEKIVAGGMAARRKASTDAVAPSATFFSATVEEGGRTETAQRRPSFDNQMQGRKKFPEEVGGFR